MTGPVHTLLLLPVITVFHKCKHWGVRTHTDTRTHSKLLFFIAFTGSDRVMMRTKYQDSLFFHFGGGGKLLSSPHQLSFHLHQTHMGHMYRPAALLRFCYRKCNHSWFEAQLILASSCSLTSIREGYISVWNTTWNPIKRELCTFWKWSEGVCCALEWIVEEKGF